MKIKITYTAAEAAHFERIRAELIQSVPDARQHICPFSSMINNRSRCAPDPSCPGQRLSGRTC